MTIERDPGRLISSDKVEGTAVYSNSKEKIGSIKNLMIDKASGQVSYAVLSFGGFLGIGDDHYPLPWKILKYDTALGGYKTGISADRLKGAPKYGETDRIWDWSDPAQGKMVDDYYA
jgi:sporulation protein YlmC with PRC-barrel domain